MMWRRLTRRAANQTRSRSLGSSSSCKTKTVSTMNSVSQQRREELSQSNYRGVQGPDTLKPLQRHPANASCEAPPPPRPHGAVCPQERTDCRNLNVVFYFDNDSFSLTSCPVCLFSGAPESPGFRSFNRLAAAAAVHTCPVAFWQRHSFAQIKR